MDTVERCLAQLDEISKGLDRASDGVRRNRRELAKMNRHLMACIFILPICVVGAFAISVLISAS